MSEPAYFTRYENLSFERTEDGILTLRFHTNGGPITFTGRTHQDLPAALEDIALDSDNTGLILTGTGDVFMDSIDGDSLGEIFKPLVWEKIRRKAWPSCRGCSVCPFRWSASPTVPRRCIRNTFC